MNAVALRRTAAWTLAALLAIIAGVGEGLHFIPGLGHAVLVGERVLVLGETPATPSLGPPISPCCECSSGTGSLPVLGEDDCPVCQILGASFAPAAPPPLLAVDVVARDTLAGLPVAATPAPALYQARAPPQG